MITAEMAARARLMNRRRSLLKLYEENAAEAKELRENHPPDWVDRAQETEDEAVLSELSERERLELRRIDEALERIRKGQYGRCEDCGEPIESERLRALPETRRCVQCGAEAEKAR